MLHTAQKTSSARASLHRMVTNAWVSPIVPSEVSVPEDSPFYTGMTYAQFILHTTLPEPTFRAMSECGHPI